jgi:phosphatidylinositol-3-phosphatase
MTAICRARSLRLRQRALVTLLVGALFGLVGPATAVAYTPPPIKHVFLIILENESVTTSFGASSPAPYLAHTLTSEGAFLSNYYAVGHASLDNYIAMVSGQDPNPLTSSDCQTFADFPMPQSIDSAGQENGEGCVYPANVPSLMSQLDHAGLTWRAYEDSMGSDPTRESATCGHPAVGSPDNTEVETPLDQYATRHDPFVYFHYVIDNQSECNADVVNLDQLPADLGSAATTRNYSFITPSLCNDGHDPTCMNGGLGGLPAANAFLEKWVPMITASPAFKQNGLLIVTFDESVGDDSACCGETPGPDDLMPGVGGPGGGIVGAALLSPFIAPGTRSSTNYNHFSMLGSIEDLFKLPRLAAAVGSTPFGADVYTRLVTITASVKSSFRSKSGRAGVKSLSLSGLPDGASVVVSCSGGKSRGCTFKSKRGTVKGTASTLTSLVKSLHLKHGAALAIAITAAGYKPLTIRYTVSSKGKLKKAR